MRATCMKEGQRGEQPTTLSLNISNFSTELLILIPLNGNKCQ
jgi:hypothetical protein